jgi:hypothetical protein
MFVIISRCQHSVSAIIVYGRLSKHLPTRAAPRGVIFYRQPFSIKAMLRLFNRELDLGDGVGVGLAAVLIRL